MTYMVYNASVHQSYRIVVILTVLQLLAVPQPEPVCTASGHAGSSTVDSTSEFAILVSYKLKGLNIIMAAEVDCYDSQQAAAGCNPAYLELKTYKIPTNKHAEARIYGQKHPRWWVQSFLAGVPTLVLGGRDGRGMLHKVHKVAVSRLQELSARAGQSWDGNMLLSFGSECLSWMLQCAKALPDQHLRFAYVASDQVIKCSHIEAGDLPQRMKQALQPQCSSSLGGGK